MKAHRCWQHDYRDVTRGRITCIDCDRAWVLVSNDKGFCRWIASPCPGCAGTGGFCRCKRAVTAKR